MFAACRYSPLGPRREIPLELTRVSGQSQREGGEEGGREKERQRERERIRESGIYRFCCYNVHVHVHNIILYNVHVHVHVCMCKLTTRTCNMYIVHVHEYRVSWVRVPPEAAHFF